MSKFFQCTYCKIIGLCFLVVFGMYGCGKESSQNEIPRYNESVFDIENISGEISDYFVLEDILLVVTVNEEDESLFTRLYACSLDGSESKEIDLADEDKEKIIFQVTGNSKKTMALLFGDYEAETIHYELVFMDEYGKEINRMDVNNVADIEENAVVNKVLITEEQDVVLGVGNRVIVINKSGEKAFELKTKSDITGLVQTSEGSILCAYNTEEGACIEYLDIEKKEWGESFLLDKKITYEDGLIVDGQYEFCYRCADGIYGYKEGKTDKIIDFVKSGVDENAKLTLIENERIIGMCSNKAELLCYQKVDQKSDHQKQIITVGGITDNNALKNQIILFNKKNEDYEIQYIDYSQNEDPIGKWNIDITAGKVPDIIDLNELPIDYYVQKGLLEDLTPYFQNDKTVKEEDIISSVLEAMKIDGKLYYVSSSFKICTIIGKKDEVGTRSGWTFQELQEFTKKNKNPFATKTKSDILDVFASTNIPQLINWETGECKFDSEEFKEILRFCNTGENYGDDVEWDLLPEMIAEGKVKLDYGAYCIEDIQFYQKMFGEEISFVGYPDEKKNGSYFSFNDCLAISSESDVKKEAWEFVKQYMSKEYQSDYEIVTDTPTRQDCYNEMIKLKSAQQDYMDDWGNTIEPMKQAKKFGSFYLELEPLSELEIQTYTNLIEQTNKVRSYDENVMKIIEEEAEEYFMGNRELEETINLIQNRVTTYVNEQK